MENHFWKDVINFLTNRLLIIFIIICLLFYFLLVKLFDLQIVKGEMYQNQSNATIVRKLDIAAPRGNIYDRFGRPLAVNESTFTINFDASSDIDDTNQVLYDFILLMEKNGESYVDDFPFSKDEPFIFEFDGNKVKETNWKTAMGIEKKNLSATAAQTFALLREEFKIDKDMPNSEARKVLALRSAIYLKRYYQYEPITFAYDVSDRTIAAIEEENDKYQGFFVDVSTLRRYPEGKYLSHILGYIGKLSDDDIAKDKDEIYKSFDKIGKAGIEIAFEKFLKGKNGKSMVEVTNRGRRVGTVGEVASPQQGDKVFLTIDSELQKAAYDIIEDTLKEIIKSKLMGKAAKEEPITTKQVFISMVKGKAISMNSILTAKTESTALNIRNYIEAKVIENERLLAEQAENEENNEEDNEEDDKQGSTEKKEVIKDAADVARGILCEAIETGKISQTEMTLLLLEQKIITGDDDYVASIKNGRKSVLSVILEKIDENELTPQMINLDPSTGSAIMLDLKDGGVLAAATYPSYDNNELVNIFNSEYWHKLNEDLTFPLNNRPFMERRAPGSTFKMITAITGLQKEVIYPTSTIRDEIVFTKAGVPYTKSWSSSNQGILNVSTALEVSSNYFFCEVAYRLGNQKSNNKLDSISALNEYMIKFGLNERTGVEIGEAYDTVDENRISKGIPNISSPALKEYNEKIRDKDVSINRYDWFDGDTVKTAIGQSLNNYTAASMAKYISILATGGKRYSLHLMNKIESPKGELIENYEPKLEGIVEIEPQNLEAVRQGMLLVSKGLHGTAPIFSDFPVTIGAKTGTAQEDLRRDDHTSFAGFMPYDNPQVVIYVVMPFGDTKAIASAPASVVAKKLLTKYIGLDNEPQRQIMNNTLAK